MDCMISVTKTSHENPTVTLREPMLKINKKCLGKSKANFTLSYGIRSLVTRVLVKLMNNEHFITSVSITVLAMR